MAENADCRFFTECLERRIPCGLKGYAVEEGYDICKKYEINRAEFNKKVRLGL